MPTKKEREYYRIGFRDGYTYHGRSLGDTRGSFLGAQVEVEGDTFEETFRRSGIGPKFTERDTMEGFIRRTKPKRKLSAWNKFVKANSKKPRFRYRNGKLNLKKMAVAFRKQRKRGGKR